MCRFSLIVCTVTRTAELEAFLGSLAAQKQPPAFEVIVVDQNPDDRLAPLLDRCRGRFPVRRLRSEIGLSRARNVGLAAASGDIVAIPDDDCTYPPDLLHRLAAYFDANPGCDGVSTLVTDRDGSFSAGGYMAGSPLAIDRGNIWRTAVSPSIFVRRSVVGEVRFDETLGVGSGTVYGSGEESDFLLQLLEHHRRLDYRPEFVVHHPCFPRPVARRTRQALRQRHGTCVAQAPLSGMACDVLRIASARPRRSISAEAQSLPQPLPSRNGPRPSPRLFSRAALTSRPETEQAVFSGLI